jgi:hypothetical protein
LALQAHAALPNLNPPRLRTPAATIIKRIVVKA